VRGADDDPDLAQEAAGAVEHPLAGHRVGVHDVPLVRLERAGLVDDLVRDRDLPHVVQERAEFGQAPAPVVEAEETPSEPDHRSDVDRAWRPGDDVRHSVYGHGWVQGAGHGRVTVRFETRSTGPGRARTFAADDPDLSRADPLASLD
jgi:DNA polymerase-4